MGISCRWIECDDCKKTCHYQCFPRKHRDAFRIEETDEDDDDLQFICHISANYVNSDCEDFILSDTDDE